MRIGEMEYVSREAYSLNAARGHRVLHLGFVGDRELGSGEMTLHERLVRVASEAWAVDLDEPGVESFRARHPELAERTLVGDACDLASLAIPGHFDLIIAGDLIEHLVAPASLLASCRPLLAPGGRLLLTTPNALGLLTVLRAWKGYEKVNPRHTLWFSFSTLREFCLQTGWIVERIVTGYDFEPRKRLTRLKYWVGAQFFRRFPQWGGTLICTLRLAPHGG